MGCEEGAICGKTINRREIPGVKAKSAAEIGGRRNSTDRWQRQPTVQLSCSPMFRSIAFIALWLLVAAGQALAADLFVEPVTASGVQADAQASFQDAIARAFSASSHKQLAAPSPAAYRVKVSITRDRSKYDMAVVVNDPTGKTVIGNATQCVPCTLEEALKHAGLQIRTVILNLDAIEEGKPRPAIAATPPPAPADGPAVPASKPNSQPAASSSGPSRWHTAMLWTFILPSVAGVASAVKVGDRYQPRCDPSDCSKHPEYLVAGLSMFFASEAFGLANLFDVAAEGGEGRHWGRTRGLLGIGTGIALGFSGYLLIRNDGYGKDAWKTIGYADLPLAALALSTGIGTLYGSASRDSEEGRTTAIIGPGFGGVRLTF